MTTTNPPRTFPAAYFLHSDLSSPKALQSILAAPHLLKLRKAFLPGHSANTNGSVFASGFGFGEWHDQDEIQGVVLYVSCQEEEDRLRQHIGEVEVKDVDVQVCMGGLWGTKDWTVGRAFVGEEVEKSVRSDVSEQSKIAVGEEKYTLKDALGLTEPIVEDRVKNIAVDNPRLKTPKPKRMALLRRITDPLRSSAIVLENNFEQAGLATKKGVVTTNTEHVATPKDSRLRLERPSLFRRHTDRVMSKLSARQDDHEHQDETSTEMSDVLSEKTAQHDPNVDTKSPEQASLCMPTQSDASSSVPTLFIEDFDESDNSNNNIESTMLNTVQQKVDLECEVEDHQGQESSTPVRETPTPQCSNAISESSNVKALPESEEVSSSPVHLLQVPTKGDVIDERVDENTVVKRTSWKPWDLFQRLQLNPSHENVVDSAQEKEVIEENADEQQSSSGVRGLVAKYEMLKK